MKKKRLSIILICLVMLLTNLLPVTAYSATADQKAIAAYKQKLKAIKKNDMVSSDKILYRFVDIDGNGIREMLCTYVHKKDHGRAQGGGGYDRERFRIYTYSKGKVICQLNEYDTYQTSSKLRYSKTSKAFRLSCDGIIGVVSYRAYYKLKNGKYVCVGSAYKNSKKGNWKYFVNGKSVSKTTFEKYVGGTQKGTLKTHAICLGYSRSGVYSY